MGEVFAGRYELVDPIGRGGVGAVWRAWDHRRRRYVAAKVLQQRDAHSLLRFVREQALRIDHPHVLAPASWAADDDKVLFTMDLVAGGSLVHLVGDYGPLPPVFVCTLLDQLLSGLAAVHAEGVVHRDIKPANVLLEATGTGRPRLRLSDFGIAMQLGDPRLTETNLVVGTPGYLAPEQMLGSEPDFPADLFAVGLVALFLLEGAKPDAKALMQYFMEHGTPGPPQGIPEPLWQVVATLLQPDPADRFRTATGARKALISAAELLPEPGPEDELIEIFDQIGPLPPGFGAEGPRGESGGVPPELPSGGASLPPSGATPAAGPDAPPAPPTPPAVDSTAALNSSSRAAPGMGAHAGTRVRVGTDTDEEASPSTGSVPSPDANAANAAADVRAGSMSDTGSFRLPPPRANPEPVPTPRPVLLRAEEESANRFISAPAVTEPPSAQPPSRSPHFPDSSPYAAWSAVPSPAPVPEHPADTTTALYTAQDRELPLQPWMVPAPSGQGHRKRHAHRRRAGPPARATILILLLAVVCYAVGFWALARV
ncbi:serine/threonine protein kinase [Streptomyces pluripotens]|uniref:non-specific serine/threonine protein kinase n=1 Tax=Streptomyces pluripotens TaxID=1355015 RepID=A0A221NZT6_9ACTN|nr:MULTISPECIES: serine/threonine-protein kinase [Streptomyces]ARP71161.1 serine/threonine protein kinase [Streptomyces pluripotens]ASN25412.1 serine/threonine protein kinase [Streptomyces pluripotens]MCH0557057.1 protein kinase [Streptomyces sp. MUM 16J]